MATITSADLEAEARAMLRSRIERAPWFPGKAPEERRAAIDLEVELWWHLMIPDAARRLVEDVAGRGGACPNFDRLTS